MNKKSILECEREKLQKWGKFRLPHVFMTIGIMVALISIITMFIRAFILEGDSEWLKELAKKGLVIGMLLMSISKDKEEDELIISLRMQSYSIAFVAGVIYAIVMPYIDYGLSNILKEEGEALKDLGDFQVLIFMLLVQLMFYHTLKRTR